VIVVASEPRLQIVSRNGSFEDCSAVGQKTYTGILRHIERSVLSYDFCNLHLLFSTYFTAVQTLELFPY